MRDFDPTASEYLTSGYLERNRPGGVLYDIGSIASVAAPIIGGIMGGDAAGDAADAQAAAAAQSDATQRYFYDTTRGDNAPFRETGLAANNRLAFLMGLQPNGSSSQNALSRDQIRQNLLGQYTKTSTSSQPVEIGLEGNNTTVWNPPSSTQSTVDEQGLNSAIEAQLAQQAQAQQAAQQQASTDPAYGSLMRNFSASDLNADPVYQSGLKFGLDQGTQGINRQAAAGGSYLSGATLKALTRFGNDYGSTKANESYNRFNTNNNNQYNKLAGLSGAGQQATNQVSAAGSNAANQISASQQGAGNARGSAYLAQGNSMQNGINGAMAAFGSGGGGNSFNSLQSSFSNTGAGSSGFGTGLAYGNQDFGSYF